MKPSRHLHAAVLAVAGTFVSAAAVADTTITLTPNERSSKDVFVYEFSEPFFGIPTPPRRTNLDTATLSMIPTLAVPFGNFLGAGVTDPFSLMPGGPLREHGIRTLIQFDLALLSVDPAKIGSATLNLWALPALPAFESPDADHPVTTDLRRVTGAWGETTATWENAPAVAAMPTSTVVQAGVEQWVSFDVRTLVQDWLANPASNFGVELSQRDVVEKEVAGARDRYFASLYASSAFGDASKRPYLEITVVPEPSTYAAMAAGLALAGAAVRRRRRA
ncbi:MAG: DNRLRE domain-containing protein [Burkholderiales bacterium]|nr:DNRLRE domain-containing protein [Burkholderiales bacterium]